MAGHRVDTGDDPLDGPIDFVGVRADDALLDAVHGRHAGTVSGPADEDLVDLLATWRAEIDARPFPELVSLDEAVAAIESGRGATAPGRPRPRLLRRVPLVAAAAMALALVGLGAAVHDAMPGQALWGVSQVVFSGRAESVESAAAAEKSLEEADDAIARSDLPGAASALVGADTHIDGVRPEDRAQLEAERRRVQSSLPPGAPGAPPVADPSSVVPGTSPAATSETDAASSPTPTTEPAPATATSVPGTGTGSGAGTTTTTTPPPIPLRLPLPGN